MSYSCVSKRIKTGKLALYGAWFDIADGSLEYYDLDEKIFKQV